MCDFKRGNIVEFDGLLVVVVGTHEDGGAPEEHLALWFGDPKNTRISEGGTGGHHPEIWTVPSAYCTMASSPIIRH